MAHERKQHLDTRPKLCPSGKFAYADEVIALDALKRYSHPNLVHQGGGQKPVRAYVCPECGFWHLTARPLDAGPRRP